MAPKQVSITIDREVIDKLFDSIGFQDMIADALKSAFSVTLTLEEWRAAFVDSANWKVRPRTASRQSCLWRHSLNWRDRKRGHPLHRQI